MTRFLSLIDRLSRLAETLAVALIFVLGPAGAIHPWQFWVWFHVIVGITWIGLLYYFNFVQVPAVGKDLAEADSGGPGPAAINKYVAPRALWWFRWGALLTWLTGAAALGHYKIFVPAFTLVGIGLLVLGTWYSTTGAVVAGVMASGLPHALTCGVSAIASARSRWALISLSILGAKKWQK